MIQIWTDGACFGNPGPGGWAFILEENGVEQEFSGYAPNTTNNIMELTAALKALLETPVNSKIILYSDSQYVVRGMTEWLKNWKKRNWQKSDGSRVLNHELWIQLDAENSKRGVTWKWIKAHIGTPNNERCDQLAKQAIKSSKVI